MSVPKILFIREVFKKDCINDDIFENKYTEELRDLVETDELTICTGTYKTYEKLPHIFTELNSWPKKTNLHCWYCTLPFDRLPIFIPKVIEPIVLRTEHSAVRNADRNFKRRSEPCIRTHQGSDESEKKYNLSVYGVFCSFGCANSFVNEFITDMIEKIEYKNRLKFLHKFIYNRPMKEFSNYPQRFLLKQYGGDLSDKEFNELIEEHNRC